MKRQTSNVKRHIHSGPAYMPWRGAFVGVCGAQHRRFIPGPADKLQAQGEPFCRESTRH